MKDNVRHITSREAFEKIRRGNAILLDIREWEEIEIFSYDIEPQIIIPMSEINERLHEIPIHTEVIIACNSGSRSHHLSTILMNYGYNNLHNLLGGIQEWLAQDLPVKWDNIIPKNVLKKEA